MLPLSFRVLHFSRSRRRLRLAGLPANGNCCVNYDNQGCELPGVKNKSTSAVALAIFIQHQKNLGRSKYKAEYAG